MNKDQSALIDKMVAQRCGNYPSSNYFKSFKAFLVESVADGTVTIIKNDDGTYSMKQTEKGRKLEEASAKAPSSATIH